VERTVGPLDDDESREGLRRAMARRVAVVFRPTRVSSWDHRKVFAAPGEPR